MRTKNLVDGINILIKYYEHPETGYHAYAEHDVLYLTQTDKPVSKEDCEALWQLGWNQEYTEEGVYDETQAWLAYT